MDGSTREHFAQIVVNNTGGRLTEWHYRGKSMQEHQYNATQVLMAVVIRGEVGAVVWFMGLAAVFRLNSSDVHHAQNTSSHFACRLWSTVHESQLINQGDAHLYYYLLHMSKSKIKKNIP